MNNQQQYQPSELDSLIGDSHLQMMKAALPYMHASEQRFFSFFIKFNELRRTINLFEDQEIAAMGIGSAGDSSNSSSPIDMLNTIKPFGTPKEQDFIDLVANFFQGFRLASRSADPVPDTTIRDTNPTQSKQASQPSSSPFGKMSLEHLKSFMPPEQQSRLETVQMMMSAMHQGGDASLHNSQKGTMPS